MRTIVLAALVVTGCSHAKDEHLTATEHRSLAELHEAKADAERSQFDPSKTRETISRSPFGDIPDTTTRPYNPTAEHLAAADREMKRAAEHSKAAARLEAFEDTACRNVPREERAACPLLASQVMSVQNDRQGVLLRLKDSADARAIEKRLQCHLAYANATSFERPSCPLFVRGMSLKLVEPKVIAMRGETPEVVAALQYQARRIFTGEEIEPISSLR
jgi:hypothetical protein